MNTLLEPRFLCEPSRGAPSPSWPSASAGKITRWLNDWRQGNDEAFARLVPLLYRDLRRLANHAMHDERSNHTLQPTALAHEALLRVLAQDKRHYHDRGHFLAVVAAMMRRVLVDHARRRARIKRGGDAVLVPLSEANCPDAAPSLRLLALDQALDALAQVDAQQAKLVELRFFAGLSVEETAAALGISGRTVKRRWRTARLWLYDHLGRHQPR